MMGRDGSFWCWAQRSSAKVLRVTMVMQQWESLQQSANYCAANLSQNTYTRTHTHTCPWTHEKKSTHTRSLSWRPTQVYLDQDTRHIKDIPKFPTKATKRQARARRAPLTPSFPTFPAQFQPGSSCQAMRSAVETPPFSWLTPTLRR